VHALGPLLARPASVARERVKPAENYTKYVRNIDEPNAARRIVDEICSVAPNVASATMRRIAGGAPAAAQIGRVMRRIMPFSRPHDRYVEHKFDQLTVSEVTAVLEVFAGADIGGFRCKPIGPNVVSISDGRTS
jgi:hypothetical protein